MLNEIFTRKGMRAGLLFGGLVAVINLFVSLLTAVVPFIAFLSLLLIPLIWVIMFFGAYTHAYAQGFTKEDTKGAVLKSAGAGLWAALIMGVVGGVVSVLVMLVFPRTFGLYGGFSVTVTYTFIDMIFTFLNQLFSSLVSGLFWFILIGILYSYFPVTSMPSAIAGFVEKGKNFLNR